MASSSTEASAASASDDHGFERPEMYTDDITGTVEHYEKHVFLCFKDPNSWPARIETSKDDDLPRLFAAALKARKSDIPVKTRLTICEASESSDGDVLIFPDMVSYKGLTAAEAEKFVEEVLVNGSDFLAERKEEFQGSYVFVCAHTKRDMRCGVCGPALIDAFTKEISDRQIAGNVFVKACSHVGGHKYAGNVIIFSRDSTSKIAGHWYGYVTPKDVPVLLDDHIGKSKIVDKLWRGQMGLSEEEQKQAYEKRSGAAGGKATPKTTKETTKDEEEQKQAHQKRGGAAGGKATPKTTKETTKESCPPSEAKELANGCCQSRRSREFNGEKTSDGYWSRCVSCFDSWERGDTLAALAVVGAVAAVALAFGMARARSQTTSSS